MKKSILILAFCLIGLLCFAQEDGISPMYYWEYTTPVTLNGRSFFSSKSKWSNSSFADSYREQDGYALVRGHKLHYWLYDTITYHSGDSSIIYNEVIPKWVENMGYVIDFDNINVSDNNTYIPNSLKALMKQRGCDVSVTIVTIRSSYYLVINEYLTDKKQYKTSSYPLYK